MKKQEFFFTLIFCVALVLIIDSRTNALDIEKYHWDFRYYIELAEKGFSAKPLLAPFAYRYPTPFIAGKLSSVFNLSVEAGFRATAYVGAILQLFGIFLFTFYFTKSKSGALLGVLVTAFSLFNLKFLLFDVYRPDHFAYAFILLAFYFGAKDQFYPLIITTIIGVQFREFALIPLVAYLLTLVASLKWKKVLIYLLPSFIGFFIAVILPRHLIPTTDSIQFVELSIAGIPKMLDILLDFDRDINFVYSIIAYILPTLMLITFSRLKSSLSKIPKEMILFSVLYTLLVLFLSFYGGTDLARFSTYLFLPQVLLIGLLAPMLSKQEILIMLLATFIFNRIWMYFPIWDIDKYVDFYGGYASRVNSSTYWRIAELLVFITLGILAKRVRFPQITSNNTRV